MYRRGSRVSERSCPRDFGFEGTQGFLEGVGVFRISLALKFRD